MDTLGRIDIFLEVARLQSFSKAARSLGITGPAASKQVMALEADLGVKLLTRTTRLVTLTDEGAAYYERARTAVDELKEAALLVQDMKIAPRGPLRVSMPLSFGHLHLLPLLSSFSKKYPDLRLDINMDDRMVDVVNDGYDMVIRIGPLRDSALIARHIADCSVSLVASPAYLKEHGTPKTPADLKNHRMIVYSNSGAVMEWKYKDAQGRAGTFRQEGVMKANTAEMMLQAAIDGVGVALLPDFTLTDALKTKKLVTLLPKYDSQNKMTVHALMPPSKYRTYKARLLLDWIIGSCNGKH